MCPVARRHAAETQAYVIDQAELEHIGPPARVVHRNKLCKRQTLGSERELPLIVNSGPAIDALTPATLTRSPAP
jgi:hypothetical protein